MVLLMGMRLVVVRLVGAGVVVVLVLTFGGVNWKGLAGRSVSIISKKEAPPEFGWGLFGGGRLFAGLLLLLLKKLRKGLFCDVDPPLLEFVRKGLLG